MNLSAIRTLGQKCSLCGQVGRGQKKPSSIGPVHVACADAIAAGRPLPRGEPEERCIPDPYTHTESPPTLQAVERPEPRKKATRKRHSPVGRTVIVRGEDDA